jgi:hypothetical protein
MNGKWSLRFYGPDTTGKAVMFPSVTSFGLLVALFFSLLVLFRDVLFRAFFFVFFTFVAHNYTPLYPRFLTLKTCD